MIARMGLATLLMTYASSASAVVPFDVSYESEVAGLQVSTSQFALKGVENFDTRPLGTGKTFTTDFGTGGAITGKYSNVQINRADQYGGAGGVGQYAVTFQRSGAYTVELTSANKRGVTYFGYWLSALDSNNWVTFYSGVEKLFTFKPQDVINAIRSQPNASSYNGNPNSNYAGRNVGEPYVFLNFYSNLRPFTRIVFEQAASSGGYESDNHTVGRFTRKSGTPVNLTQSQTTAAAFVPAADVPEPATWAMLIAGFGLVGAAARRRRHIVAC